MLLSGTAGSQGTSLGCSYSGGEEPTHRAELSMKAWNLGHLSTNCKMFRGKAQRGMEQRTCPPLSAALTHCRSCNNCTERARPLQSCCQVLCLIWDLRAPLPAWGLHTGPEETQAHRAAGMEQECVLRVAQE